MSKARTKGLGALIRGWAGLGGTTKPHDHEAATGWGKPMAVVAEELSVAVEHEVRIAILNSVTFFPLHVVLFHQKGAIAVPWVCTRDLAFGSIAVAMRTPM